MSSAAHLIGSISPLDVRTKIQPGEHGTVTSGYRRPLPIATSSTPSMETGRPSLVHGLGTYRKPSQGEVELIPRNGD